MESLHQDYEDYEEKIKKVKQDPNLSEKKRTERIRDIRISQQQKLVERLRSSQTFGGGKRSTYIDENGNEQLGHSLHPGTKVDVYVRKK